MKIILAIFCIVFVVGSYLLRLKKIEDKRKVTINFIDPREDKFNYLKSKIVLRSNYNAAKYRYK